jgi:hypothetical protein
MKNMNITQGNLLGDKMNVELDILRAAMMNRIDGEIYRTNVVTIYNCSTINRSMKFV